MIFNPILPVWLVAIIAVALIVVRVKDKWGLLTQIIISILIFAMNLRPMLTSGSIQTNESNLNVIFVVDNTLSMRAEDFNGNDTRFNGMKADCEAIIDELEGAQFSLVSFNIKSQVVCPLTKDSNMLKNGFDKMPAGDAIYCVGSTLDKPVDDLESVLDAGNTENTNRKNIVIFISDGEDNKNSDISKFKKLKNKIDGGFVLGYGTQTGGKMQTRSSYDNSTEYIYDYETFQDAVSKIDETNLNNIANNLGIPYVHSTGQSEYWNDLGTVKNMIEYEKTDITEGAQDIYFVFLIPLFVMLGVEWFIFERKRERL